MMGRNFRFLGLFSDLSSAILLSYPQVVLELCTVERILLLYGMERFAS